MPHGYQKMLSVKGHSRMTALPRTAVPGSLYGGPSRPSPGFLTIPQSEPPPMYGQPPQVEAFTPTIIPPNPAQINDSFELIDTPTPSYPSTPRAPSKKSRRENMTIEKKLTPINSIEMTPNIAMGDAQTTWIEKCKIKISTNPFLMLTLFLLMFILFDIWSNVIQNFISQKFHDGKEVPWKSLLLYAILLTVGFLILVWVVGVPFTQFESI